MRIEKTEIPGLLEIFPLVFEDDRGTFVKTIETKFFENKDLNSSFAEEFYTYSRHGVLRGLHFQVPPMDHVKLVHCIAGEVLDAVVDLRVGSPTYGRHKTFRLGGSETKLLYIPSGLAHGFLVTGNEAIMAYKVTTAHSPEHDSGILWSSAGIPWPAEAPIVSDRDRLFTPLSSFQSPFRYLENRTDG